MQAESEWAADTERIDTSGDPWVWVGPPEVTGKAAGGGEDCSLELRFRGLTIGLAHQCVPAGVNCSPVEHDAGYGVRVVYLDAEGPPAWEWSHLFSPSSLTEWLMDFAHPDFPDPAVRRLALEAYQIAVRAWPTLSKAFAEVLPDDPAQPGGLIPYALEDG